jgi:S-formylglutathione hydrolase FrmB
MGGHGAWILGVQFPDLFAAIGPSAGWISFRTYASRQKDEGSAEIEKLAGFFGPDWRVESGEFLRPEK